ncbi:uncharacterized protein TNCV_1606861 [Trichonephila clavipes]|nr:uncharacterized protein TNCV_1606861 [Trichonephila clavipes]
MWMQLTRKCFRVLTIGHHRSAHHVEHMQTNIPPESENASIQSNDRFWAAENLYNFHHTPLHDQKIGVWCAMAARCITCSIFLRQMVNSGVYISNVLNAFVVVSTEEAVSRGQYDFGPSWPPKKPDLSLYDYFLWGTKKSNVYRHSLQQNISEEIAVILADQLRSVFRNMGPKVPRDD